jgi:hypothetical protein
VSLLKRTSNLCSTHSMNKISISNNQT